MRVVRPAALRYGPSVLLVIDEADRLKIAGLEQVRSIFDQGGTGMILIGSISSTILLLSMRGTPLNWVTPSEP